MGIGFIVVSIVALIFLGIGISCRRANEAVGFFTFAKPPKVENVKDYNIAVSILWFVAAGVVEILGISMLFFKQNSPIFEIFAVVILVIVMMYAYIKIEAKYKK